MPTEPPAALSDQAAGASTETTPLDAAPPTLEPPKPPEPTPEPTPAPGATPAPTPPVAPDEGESESIAKYFDRLTGRKLAEKYGTDDEWVKGIDNLVGRIGERDADAELGKEFRDKAPEIRELLAKQTPATKDSPVDSAITSFDLSWVTQDAEGRTVPTASAPSDVRERHSRYQAAMARRADEFFRDPSVLLEPLRKENEAQLEQQREEIYRQQDVAALNNWNEENKDWVYVNSDPNGPLTAAGQKWAARVDKLGQGGMFNITERLDTAKELIQAGQPPLKKPKKAAPKGKGSHQPAVAAAPAVEQTAEEMIDAGKSLTEVLVFQEKQRKLAAE